MYVRNLLKAGQFVTPVPVGLPITLQYDMNGQLEQVFLGHDDSRVNVSEKLLPAIMQERNAPVKIPLAGGTSWVMGVLYSGDLFPVNGTLPEASNPYCMEHYLNTPEMYKFYAGNVFSNSTQFRGSAATRQWLNNAKFAVLPGFLVPPNMNPMLFRNLMRSAKYPFKSELVQSYIIHDSRQVLYVDTGLRQIFAGTVTSQMTEDGHLLGVITHKGLPEKLETAWANVVNYNLQPNSIIVTDPKGRILHAEPGDTKNHTPRTRDISCSICGKPYSVRVGDYETICPDEHCLSRMYPRVVQMLEVLRQPIIKYTTYIEAVKAKEILVLADVLTLPQYAESSVEATAASVLRACIPYEVCPDTAFIESFCTRCNNKIANIRYYLQHPDILGRELGIVHVSLNQVVSWLQDNVNAAEIEALFDSENINFVGVDKLFMGTPILRNKTIMITGKFTHGTSGEVTRILQSYDARVVYDLKGKVDCVVVGDCQEDINSAAIRSAKACQVPVLSEKQFFDQFKIDEDLADHL